MARDFTKKRNRRLSKKRLYARSHVEAHSRIAVGSLAGYEPMSNVLVIAVVGATVPLVLRWLYRGSLREAADGAGGDAFTMKPSRRHHLFIYGLLAFCASFGAVIGLNENDWQLGAVIGVAFAAMPGLYSLSLIRRIYVTDDGIQSVSPIGMRRQFRWKNLAKVSFREWGQTIRIRCVSGKTIVVPLHMAGLRELEQALLKHAPPGARGTVAFDEVRAYVASR